MTHQIPPGGLPALNIALDHDGGRVDPRTPKRVLSALDRAGLIRRDGAAWMVTAQGEAAVKATTGGQEGSEPRATVAELLGADPDWCGGESVDEYVRAHRDRTPAPVPGRGGNVLDDTHSYAALAHRLDAIEDRLADLESPQEDTNTPAFDEGLTTAIATALARVLDINGWGIDQAAPPAGWVEIIADAVRPEMDRLAAERDVARREERERCAAALEGQIEASEEMGHYKATHAFIDAQQLIRALGDEETTESCATPQEFAAAMLGSDVDPETEPLHHDPGTGTTGCGRGVWTLPATNTPADVECDDCLAAMGPAPTTTEET